MLHGAANTRMASLCHRNPSPEQHHPPHRCSVLAPHSATNEAEDSAQCSNTYTGDADVPRELSTLGGECLSEGNEIFVCLHSLHDHLSLCFHIFIQSCTNFPSVVLVSLPCNCCVQLCSDWIWPLYRHCICYYFSMEETASIYRQTYHVSLSNNCSHHFHSDDCYTIYSLVLASGVREFL